jgi:hypothetical protein
LLLVESEPAILLDRFDEMLAAPAAKPFDPSIT